MSIDSHEARLVRVETTVNTMKNQLTALTEIPTQLSSLNATLKVIGAILVLCFPVLCTWNYYLGNVVTNQGVRLSVLEMQVAYMREEIKSIKLEDRNGLPFHERNAKRNEQHRAGSPTVF